MGLVKTIERAGQEKEAFTYDAFGAPLTMAASYNGTSKGGLTLTFDALSGRITTKQEAWMFAGLTSKTWAYEYDAAGRLSEASDGITTHVYVYDDNGNRSGATVDAQDRVTSQTDNGTTTSYTYDDHGNVSTRTRTGAAPLAQQGMTWDSQGSLLAVTGASQPVKYIVDANGRRVGRRTNGTLDREWLYDGQLRIVGEIIHGGTPRYRLYGYLQERHLPVSMTETVGGVTKTYRIYGDHLGSLRAVVDSVTGNVVQTMQHGPWGEILTGTDTVAGGFVRVPFGFAGGNYDEVTGLVRFGAREYDSGTGRWLSKDEARFGGGWNFYEYAEGDPINLVDVDGLAPGDPYPSVDAAARAALGDTWRYSKDTGWEWSTWIYMLPDGKTYSYDAPGTAYDPMNSNRGSSWRRPKGAKNKAHVHSHPPLRVCDPHANEFSFMEGGRGDLVAAYLDQLPEYLAAPGGYFKFTPPPMNPSYRDDSLLENYFKTVGRIERFR